MELADRVARGPSAIHGTGCFARVPMECGDFIGTFEGVVVHRDGSHVLWVNDGERERGLRGTNVLRYLNHRQPPNAAFEGSELYAVAAIEAGEEITIDYQPDQSGATPSGARPSPGAS